ncbi:MAG TPA: hypothetical protein VNF47_00205 [Streptosporangiaceae bacterium]|nr:hypothetical protein [Streptosporangiaceae bacterium]
MRLPQPAAGPASGASAGDSATDAVAAAEDAPASAQAAPVDDSPASSNGAPRERLNAPGEQLSGHQNGAAGPRATPGGKAELNGSAGLNGDQHAAGEQVTSQPARRRGATALLAGWAGIVRQHWLASAVVAGGIVLRAMTQMAYHPAIIYIDTLKYLYGQWPGSDPVAYKIPLKLILAFGDLGTVEFIQHLLGVAIAVTLYAVLIRRGAPRWLGALAIAPVLFDAYQLNVEAMIMPDIWFEAFLVAGLAVLLWRPRPTVQMLVVGTALLGASTGIRQVGEILIVPAVVFVVAMGGGWRTVVKNTVAVTCAFAVAVLMYMGAAFELTHHFRISESSGSLTYGRMATVVNCATLNIPAVERPLCPTKWEVSQGPDWLDHSTTGPLRTYASKLPPNLVADHNQLAASFNRSVELQQPLRVIGAVLRDAVKVFALTRTTSPGDTPIWRWQFHGYFPTFPYVHIRGNRLWITLPPKSAASHLTRTVMLSPAYGGAPQVDKPIAAFLRSYQLDGGYTPGPLLALFVLTGLAGSVLLFARRRLSPAALELALACLGFFVAGVAVLAVSDAFEFTWRYQLPALVTLPPAGALGIAALISVARRRRAPVSAQAVSPRAPELTAPAQ